MSARVGQVDQAVKTRTVGYLRRRLVSMLENVTIEHDGTARLIGDQVLQFQHDRTFEAGDAAGGLCATMIAHAAFQASLDAFKHTDANSGSAPGLPAFLKLVAAPEQPAAHGHWVPHDALTGQPDPWIKLQDVLRLHGVHVRGDRERRHGAASLRWTGSTMGRGTVVGLDAVAMLASNVSVGDVAAAVRRALVKTDGRHLIAPCWRAVSASCCGTTHRCQNRARCWMPRAAVHD